MQATSEQGGVHGPAAGTQGVPELRGLLHDLGHGLATLSYLTAGIRRDPALPGRTRHRLDMLDQELSRLLDLVRLEPGERVEEVFGVRDVLEQLVALVTLSTRTRVVLLPGAEVTLCSDPVLLWRIAANLVHNAVRAAGPCGSVELVVREDHGVNGRTVAVEVADNGPGFGAGPRGTASLGLGIVNQLARTCGARLRVHPVHPHGTRVRLVFGGDSA